MNDNLVFADKSAFDLYEMIVDLNIESRTPLTFPITIDRLLALWDESKGRELELVPLYNYDKWI